MAQHPHIFVPPGPDPIRFTLPTLGRSDPLNLPQRNRASHANALVQQLNNAQAASTQRVTEQRAQGIDDGLGIYLTFESEPNFEMKFESLDVVQSGIELCTVKTAADNRTSATVFVPDGKLAQFIRKVEAYRDQNTTPSRPGGPSRPKNEDLVASIAGIRLAALEGLWTEPGVPFPATDSPITWEVWLRRDDGRTDHLTRLREYAASFELAVGDQFVSFIDRQVVLVRGTPAALSRSSEILGMIAELRLPKATAAFFTAMNGMEQEQWAIDLAGRVSPPPANAPYICLLDTGLNHLHPLLTPIAGAGDLHTYKPAWGADDREGHGTPMAGLAVYGDLAEILEAGGPVQLTHKVESVKIVNDNDPTEPELYGAVMQESVFRVEVTPDRSRVFCMAITATDGRDRGSPTSWSAAVDALASGSSAEGDRHRLMIISGGNTIPTIVTSIQTPT